MNHLNHLTRTTRRGLRGVLTVLMVLGLVGTAGAQSAEVVEYYHLDALGSVRAVTNQSGAVVRTHDYRPFGEGENPAAGSEPTRFTSKERDAESGLDYFGARYYASRTGRFTTVDPLMGTELALVDPQRWNRYSYVGNRPTRLLDPDGRGWASALFKVGKAVYKGADIASEFYGLYEDAKTLVASDSTLSQRAWAGLSLASEIWSPVSLGDAKAGASFAVKHSDDVSSIVRRSADAGTLAIGRGTDLAKVGAVKPGEYAIIFEATGVTQIDWKTNAGRLRDAMSQGRPIRDVSPGDKNGLFLNLERRLLEDRGWSFDQATGLWMPPGS
jgi:RHS repeat-associated protein